jgi:hypothetical protein
MSSVMSATRAHFGEPDGLDETFLFVLAWVPDRSARLRFTHDESSAVGVYGDGLLACETAGALATHGLPNACAVGATETFARGVLSNIDRTGFIYHIEQGDEPAGWMPDGSYKWDRNARFTAEAASRTLSHFPSPSCSHGFARSRDAET